MYCFLSLFYCYITLKFFSIINNCASDEPLVATILPLYGAGNFEWYALLNNLFSNKSLHN